MEIGVAVNPVAVSIANLSSLTPPAGVRAAYRGEYDHDGVTYAQVLALLGDWQERDDGAQHSLSHDDVPPVAAQAMTVTVTADPSRIDSLLAAIDFQALAALIR